MNPNQHLLSYELGSAPRWLPHLMTTSIGIVEDSDEDFVALQRTIGQTSGEVTVQRWSRAEALVASIEAGEHALPDLLFIDLSLPGIDGCDLVKRLRMDPVAGSLPLFMLSGSSRERDVKRCYASGANSYLTKPLRTPELQAVLKLSEACRR